MVQVHHDEGVANRIDPESCADAREGIGEALTGERIGQPLSRDSTLTLGPDSFPGREEGRGEAASAIVAGKPTNKAERSAAEPAEPRAEAKGNAGQQSTRRAQNRVSVSQALERIRQTARQRKKEKFTALFHHVSVDHLEEAFFELKENAARGVDGLTCRDYEQHLERNLEDLHARVHRGAYRARPPGAFS